ncbi:M23 family metallopeptidase [Terrabacter sp. BE26]|uniref:M23 family metallopeptidase n=1 Tax=Terrabacter sp. BE26 TaxID=2898152 RepID=UPI0035BE7B34
MPKNRYVGRHRPAARPSRGRQIVVPVALLSSTVAAGLVIHDTGTTELNPEAVAMKNVSNAGSGAGVSDPDVLTAAAGSRVGARSSRDLAGRARTVIAGATQTATQTAGEAQAAADKAVAAAKEQRERAVAAAHRWVSPVSGYRLTSGFGFRWGKMHPAQDLACPVGSSVHALSSGTVVFAGWSTEGYGNFVKIRYWDGTVSWMAHNSRLLVSVGDEVSPGQVVAYSGDTGHSTGPHVHLEIHPEGGAPVPPVPWLAAHGIYL